MCYVVAKKRNGIGSCAFRTKHGKELVLLKKKIKPQKELQIVTISKPSAFGEYAPYKFAQTEEEFFELVSEL